MVVLQLQKVPVIASPVIAMDSVAGSAAEQLEEMKKQTSFLAIIADASEGEDSSKSGEAI